MSLVPSGSSATNPIVGFDINDHQIRGLMRFIEMTSRESKNKDDVQVAGVLITKGGQI